MKNRPWKKNIDLPNIIVTNQNNFLKCFFFQDKDIKVGCILHVPKWDPRKLIVQNENEKIGTISKISMGVLFYCSLHITAAINQFFLYSFLEISSYSTRGAGSCRVEASCMADRACNYLPSVFWLIGTGSMCPWMLHHCSLYEYQSPW